MTRKRRAAGNTALSALTLGLALLVLFPVFYGLCGAFKTAAEFSAWPPTVLPASFQNTANFDRVFAQAPMPRYYLNSFIMAAMTSAVRLILAVLSAYAFVFFDFPGHKVCFFLLLGTMMMPAETLTIANYQTVSRLGLIDTYLGMGIVSFAGASQMFMLRQHFLTSPRALREAAMLDGCGDLRFLFSILTPTASPLMATLFLQSFLAQWNAYLWPLLVTNRPEMRTVQVGLTMLTTPEATNYEVMLAGAAVVMLPAMLIYTLMRKQLSRAMENGPLLS